VPLSGYGDYTEAEIDERWPVRETLPKGPVQLAFDLEECFIKSIPTRGSANRIEDPQRKAPWQIDHSSE
jgi:hypothetical protein